jgi:hypothetical protein
MWYLAIWPTRLPKQKFVLDHLSRGLPFEHEICVGPPPDPKAPFIAIGQMGLVEEIVPQAIEDGRPFWLLDNGYYKSSSFGKHMIGHFELTYKGIVPVLMQNPDYDRFPDVLEPWQDNPRGHVVIGLPGNGFGKVIGLNMDDYIRKIVGKVKRTTDRRIIVRQKYERRSIDADLAGAYCLVTHSSNVAVDAIVRGIPAIVASTSPAAPVARTSLKQINDLVRPDRVHWWASLMCQQFTPQEMAAGVAWKYMKRVMEQVG